MHHVRFCLSEIAAEIDAAFANDEHVRALAQLDAREANGEPLQAVSGAALRAKLLGQIERNGFTAAKAQLRVLESALAIAYGVASAPKFDTATALAVKKKSAAEIIDLAGRRELAQRPMDVTTAPINSRPSRIVRVSGLIGGLVVAVLMTATTFDTTALRRDPANFAQISPVKLPIVIADSE